MDFYQNLKRICQSRGTTVSAVLKELDINKSHGTHWKNGTDPNMSIAVALSEYLGVSLDYLISGKESDSSLTEDERKLVNFYRRLSEREQQRLIGRAELLAEQVLDQTISIITHVRHMNIAQVAAGAGISTTFTNNNEFELKEFPNNAVPYNADCGVPINGDSMEPDYPHGCIVWVKCNDDVQDGDMVIAILNGAPYFKIYKPDGLYSINQTYDPIIVTEHDEIKIFGKVIGYYTEQVP